MINLPIFLSWFAGSSALSNGDCCFFTHWVRLEQDFNLSFELRRVARPFITSSSTNLFVMNKCYFAVFLDLVVLSQDSKPLPPNHNSSSLPFLNRLYFVLQQFIVGLSRDLRGLAFSFNTKTSFLHFFDWLYPFSWIFTTVLYYLRF